MTMDFGECCTLSQTSNYNWRVEEVLAQPENQNSPELTTMHWSTPAPVQMSYKRVILEMIYTGVYEMRSGFWTTIVACTQ